jgi:hypothetical protein
MNMNRIAFERIVKTHNIAILSGEGEVGTRVFCNAIKTYNGLKSRLYREKCKGDRWAKAQYNHNGVWVDL